MALVNVTNVVVLDNPTAFSNPLTFEVTFECLQELDAGESPDVCLLSFQPLLFSLHRAAPHPTADFVCCF